MKNPDRIDLERSLAELSDEEAIAIMEGKNPAADDQQLHDAAQAFAREVLGEKDARPSEAGGGGNVVQLIVRQPWMKLAAAVVLGVGLGTLVRAPMQVADLTPGASVASANVVYLETTRSADPGNVPTVKIMDDEPWISFVTYPDFEGAKLLRLQIERAQDQANQSLGAIRSGQWETISSSVAGLGTEDSVVMTIDATLLTPGYHRLRVISELGGDRSMDMSFVFLVVR